jgi:hypothetical protein
MNENSNSVAVKMANCMARALRFLCVKPEITRVTTITDNAFTPMDTLMKRERVAIIAAVIKAHHFCCRIWIMDKKMQLRMINRSILVK